MLIDQVQRGCIGGVSSLFLLGLTGFYRYAVEEELLDYSPAAHVRRPRLDYESHAAAWTATSSARSWSRPGSGRRRSIGPDLGEAAAAGGAVGGYGGSDRNFRRLVAEQKALWRREHHRGRRRGARR